MNTAIIEEAVEKYGTPMYLYDLDKLQNTCMSIRQNLDPKIALCYAVKANAFLVQVLAPYVDRFELCSPGETKICRKARIDTNRWIVSGVLKEKKPTHQILRLNQGKGTYTIESISQLELLHKWSSTQRKTIKVLLRLTSGNQFGMDEDVIGTIIHERKQYPFLDFVGIHYFSGTQKRGLDHIIKEIIYLDEFCQELEKTDGFFVRELEYGPGIGVSYFTNQKVVFPLEETFRKLSGFIQNMKGGYHVTLEMGRVIAAACGTYVSRVQDWKKNGDRYYCILDGGIHQMHYDGQVLGMYPPKINHIHMNGCDDNANKEEKRSETVKEEQLRKDQKSPVKQLENKHTWTVCGALCTTGDVLCAEVELTNLQTGDALAFEQTGAYAAMEGMALFLSRDLPKIVTYTGQKGYKLLRKQIDTYRFNCGTESDGFGERA